MSAVGRNGLDCCLFSPRARLVGGWHPGVMLCSEAPAVQAAEAGHPPQQFRPPGDRGDQVGRGLERAHEERLCLTGASGGEESQERYEGTCEETAHGANQRVLLEKVSI